MVSHLQFADDTIFFGEASENNIEVIKGIMRTFEMVSGLKIDFAKSQLMGVGIEESWRVEMAFRLCFKEGDFPFKYLGIPIGGNNRRVAMWQPMVDSFKRKLTSWKGRHLSMGGRITLINSVLSSLPVFLMSAYVIPKENKEGLWKSIITKKYGKGGGHWQDWVKEHRATSSIWWRDVCSLNTVDREKVGWLTEGFRISIGEADVKISQGKPDEWEWVHDKDGHYSTKTAYSLLTQEQRGSRGTEIFRRIWNPLFPSKVSAFNWQLVLDRIPTRMNLLRRGITKDMEEGRCAICGEADENAGHLFLNCKCARWIWKACAKWWGAKILFGTDCWNTFQNFGAWTKNKHTREGWDCIWNTVIWSIWLSRNQKIFQDKEINLGKLFELIQLRSFLWIKATNDRYAFSLTDWLINPIICLKVTNGSGRLH
ncbi:hypothetical protein SLEP1_g58010 [Rubroshorea leprosula]|uniref:Reverse transcriptase domain-containing protein n=1 Tax=Rubroshorea leprosula TaxID=152421 RepID=A0AAV5MPI8_9ROSI|nr:hypothetical protein SLEP1_g58010 [Rubroshorea leprosula]